MFWPNTWTSKKLIQFNFWKIWLDFLPYFKSFLSQLRMLQPKYHRLNGLNNRSMFLKVLEVGKSRSGCWWIWCLWKLSQVLRQVSSHCCVLTLGLGRPLQSLYIFFFFLTLLTQTFFFCHTAVTWDLNSLTRDPTCAFCIGRQSLNRWTLGRSPLRVSSYKGPSPCDLTSWGLIPSHWGSGIPYMTFEGMTFSPQQYSRCTLP